MQDESRQGLTYFHETIFSGLPVFLRRIDTALASIGQPNLPLEHVLFAYGAWMGGDRDGNPFVTPDTTRQALGGSCGSGGGRAACIGGGGGSDGNPCRHARHHQAGSGAAAVLHAPVAAPALLPKCRQQPRWSPPWRGPRHLCWGPGRDSPAP